MHFLPIPCRVLWWSPILALGLMVLNAAPAAAQLDFDREPIRYSDAETDDPVARLQQRIDSGEVELEHDDQHGYLRAVLEVLEVPQSSQVLVASKTSFQLRKISPRRPRALYFNDQVSVGWVQGGDVLEIMAQDPRQGAVFYTLDQEASDEPPRLVRDGGQCISCHATSRTQGVPGGLVRSVYMDRGGQPHYGSGTFDTDHSSPFAERWGGWYVTGTHGDMRHMGNAIAADKRNPEAMDLESGANVTDLTGLVDVEPYLTPHSDIVALMVLEHQLLVQNHLTLAGFEARAAAHHDGIMNEAFGRPADHVSDTTERRIASVGEKLLRAMLLVNEFPLRDPVCGTSTFAEDFQSQGPRDSKGRSLRDLDLRTRLFKYPCSYLIYSPAFDALPEGVRRYVAGRLREVLAGKDKSEEFSHLSSSDRRAILEILTETKPDLWDL